MGKNKKGRRREVIGKMQNDKEKKGSGGEMGRKKKRKTGK